MSAKSKPVFLDIDSSIVENNLRFAQNEEEDFTKLFTNATKPSKLVKPSPGLCVKTKEVGTSTKVFVNVCQTDAIPPPKEITEQELLELLKDEEPDFKVPMSIGETRTEKDKNNIDAKVVDIAINPKFFKKIESIQSFKEFFMAVAFQIIIILFFEHKYGLVCVDEKIILRNKRAFGILQSHRIEQREIDEKMGKQAESNKSVLDKITGRTEEPKKKVLIETISSAENKVKEPEYRLYKKKGGQNCLIGEFRLPNLVSVSELTLDIGEDRILLESTAKGYFLDIFVPYVVRRESCTSTFEKASKVLTVTMPLVGG
ncbi:unnamed protein product [Brassicogethes aeneus]|uniref:PIH1 domain-containing protein 1 n=1 Tax=Brassicogethes aeneus TaxID=1431903 RepID=A0A9P0B6R4_BRAAE|nr:unnamed protein product [Brassicogethes aeneus]